VRRGFTLGEMLVVIGIVSVVAAISFPAFASVRESGRETTCINNLRQVYGAISLYRSDHDGEGVYGDASKMGLPPTPVTLVHTKLIGEATLHCTGEPLPGMTKPLYMYFWRDADEEVGMKNSWSDYVRAAGPNSILVGDTNHRTAGKPRLAPLVTHFGIGLHLDGHVSRRSAQGDWGDLTWWTPQVSENKP